MATLHRSLDNIRPDENGPVGALRHWRGLMKPGDDLMIRATDIGELCRRYVDGALEIGELQKAVHGTVRNPTRAYYTVEQVEQYVKDAGFRLVTASRTGVRIEVSAR